MKLFQIAFYTSLALCAASTAYAQYGLYGSPEVLQLAAGQTASGQYAAPVGYPATSTPTAEQLPGMTYHQPATAAQQSVQPAAQYQYQNPYAVQAPPSYVRRPSRLTVARQPGPVQPIPAPPAAPATSGSYANAPVAENQHAMPQPAEATGNRGCGPFCGLLERYEQAACGGCADQCGCDACCGGGYDSHWYASIAGLVLGRSHGRRLWTSYADGDVTDQLTNTQFDMQWKWGGEVRFGRRSCCCCTPYALEAVYWTTEAFFDRRYTTNGTGYVSTPLVVTPMTFGGAAAQNWFDGAEEHRLWRRNEFHNVEFNFVHEQLAWADDSPWDIGWSLGVRYFRFEEHLTFGSLRQGYSWGDSGGEAYFSEQIANNLVGFQFGFDAAYNIWNGVRLFITPKVGIYNNYMDQRFRAYTNDGRVGSGPYGSFPVESDKNCIAFLTQIDVGADWQFSRNWSARVGYRVVAATGMALADEQFPQYMVDTPEIADIQHYSNLVLHGAFVGLTYNF
ncbi:MAG: hypothetical protein JW959_12805 [Pirellulales bacterium]|nr:hypothetical protein [Pirellulales bacterium]